MIGYTTIGTSDMEKACAFYDELLALVGGSQLMGMDRIKFYGNGEGGMLAICIPYNEEAQACGNGNMIAIHNVVAASATVGLLGREGATLRITILPTLYYLAVIGALGLIAVNLLAPGGPLWG